VKDSLKDELVLWLGLHEADRSRACFPLVAFFEQFYTLETLENVALSSDGSATYFETSVLGHE